MATSATASAAKTFPDRVSSSIATSAFMGDGKGFGAKLKARYFAVTRPWNAQGVKQGALKAVTEAIGSHKAYSEHRTVLATLAAAKALGVTQEELRAATNAGLELAIADSAENALYSFISHWAKDEETRHYFSAATLEKALEKMLTENAKFYSFSIPTQTLKNDPRADVIAVLFATFQKLSPRLVGDSHPLENLQRLQIADNSNILWQALNPTDVANAIVADFTSCPMHVPTNIERLDLTFWAIYKNAHLGRDLPNAVIRLLRHHCTADDAGQTLENIITAALACPSVKADLRRIVNDVTCYVLGVKDSAGTSYEPLAEEEKIAALLRLEHVVRNAEHLDYKIFRDVCAANGVYATSNVRPHPAGTINSGSSMLQGIVFFEDGNATVREGNVTYTRPLDDLIQHIYGENSNVCAWARTNFISTFLPTLDYLADDAYGTKHKPVFVIEAAKAALERIQPLGIAPKRDVRQPL